MIDKRASLEPHMDRKGQMPFSLVAVILILVSSFSAVLLADLHDGCENSGLEAEDLREMVELGEEARLKVEDLCLQALLDSSTGAAGNETSMSQGFKELLEVAVEGAFPYQRSEFTVHVDVSRIGLSFLRLPLAESEADDSYSGAFIPAYVGLTGTVCTRVASEDGNLTKVQEVRSPAKVPWPLLMDRLESFEGSVSNGLGTLSSLTNRMLASLAAYRGLQGWGVPTHSPGQGVKAMITERDVINAIDLGLILIQYKTFRNASPCYGIFTDHMDGRQSWEHITGILSRGGSLDPADVFLSLYGCEEVDWGAIFAHVIYSMIEPISLRWMEFMGLMDLVSAVESIGDQVVFSVNDIIDQMSGTDLLEEQFREWMQGKFDEAGVPDTQYRYFGAGVPDVVIDAPYRSMDLPLNGGGSVTVGLQGLVAADIPTVDVMEWPGWGEFHEQYKKGTAQILKSARSSIARTADLISTSMFLPTTDLSLDPWDGLSFLDEVRQVLDGALLHRDEWVRPALSAAALPGSPDPLAEATKRYFLENRPSILERDACVLSMMNSVAENLLTRVMEQNPGSDIKAYEGLQLLTYHIMTDDEWGVMALIRGAYDRVAERLQGYFLEGMDHRPQGSEGGSMIADIIARSGDPTAGMGAALSGGVRSLLDEMSHASSLQGDMVKVEMPGSSHFTLVDRSGRKYLERLEVEVSYPTLQGPGEGLVISIQDPIINSADGQGHPQLHDTNLLKRVWASYQSVWRINFTGGVEVKLSPGGGVACLDMLVEKEVRIRSDRTLAVMTGLPLMGVEYRNINTLQEQLADLLEQALRPVLEAIEWITDGVGSVFRMLEEAVSRLLDASAKALEVLSSTIQELVEKVQRFIRDTLNGAVGRLIEGAVRLFGERAFSLNFLGVSMTIRTHPKELISQGASVPVSFTMGMKAAGCAISVTTRMAKTAGEFSLLTNASLCGSDWAAHLVIDPLMSVFRHMVEVRGFVDGCYLEMVMPEVVCYREVTFALSDVPGVGALLSNIPTPIPGIKGCVDAGVTFKLLEGRTDSVVINEYELNPAGEDEGREWVELYNPTTEAIDLSGWTLQTTHGHQSLAQVTGLLMPKGRLVHQFSGQALDNLGKGFPAEDSVILRDASGRRVDSTPFSTDYWNDGRTWQRARDGADRWEFREGTRGRSNGPDLLANVDMSDLQEAFVFSVSEAVSQLTSTDLDMDSLAEVLRRTLARTAERLTADIMGKEVEISLFLEVAATEASSTARAGMSMELALRCGTLGEVLDHLARSARSLVSTFGDPFQAGHSTPGSPLGAWVGISAFGSIGIPRMIATPGVELEISYKTSLNLNLQALSLFMGQRREGWAVEMGVAVCGVPSNALAGLGVTPGTSVDVWLCKITLHGDPMDR